MFCPSLFISCLCICLIVKIGEQLWFITGGMTSDMGHPTLDFVSQPTRVIGISFYA